MGAGEEPVTNGPAEGSAGEQIPGAPGKVWSWSGQTLACCGSLQPVRKGGMLVLCHLLEEGTFPLESLSPLVDHRENFIAAQSCSSVLFKRNGAKMFFLLFVESVPVGLHWCLSS